jgi:putative FmdB family regulatory protein
MSAIISVLYLSNVLSLEAILVHPVPLRGPEDRVMNYAFHCQSCGEQFDVSESLAEHEQHQEKCPKCGSTDVRQKFDKVSFKTSKKS